MANGRLVVRINLGCGSCFQTWTAEAHHEDGKVFYKSYKRFEEDDLSSFWPKKIGYWVAVFESIPEGNYVVRDNEKGNSRHSEAPQKRLISITGGESSRIIFEE